MQTVYTQSKEVLAKFLLLVLPDAIGRRKWNRLSKALKPSKFVSCSDEAFAMIVIENNSAKWLNMLINPTMTTKEMKKLKTKYTQNEEHMGWAYTGIYRFTQLTTFVLSQRKLNKDLTNLMDEICSNRLSQSKMQRNEKRKLDEYMRSVSNYDELVESRRLQEEERRKNEQMNTILLNMCMKGNDFDISEFGDPVEL